MYVDDRDSLERLQEAATRGRKTRSWPRIQAILLAKQGDTAPQIARALGVSRRSVQAWVAAYNRGGFPALPDRAHPARAPILPRSEEGRFLERLDGPPRPEDEVCEPRGTDIRRILEQEFAAWQWSCNPGPKNDGVNGRHLDGTDSVARIEPNRRGLEGKNP